jgi:hypothetical protein
MASNNNGGEEADSSGEGFIAAVECDFKRQTWPPIDHFKKLLDATCSHLPYPVKHKLKLKDCTMIKKFMTSGAPSRGSKLGGNPGGKSAAPIPEEAEVMTIFG